MSQAVLKYNLTFFIYIYEHFKIIFYIIINICSRYIMSKSKLTLIIDGNWLLMSRVSVLIARYDDYELRSQLQLLLTRSIKLVLKQFPQIDNIIFIADGGSWRNTLEIPDYLLDEKGNKISYKGNRERDEEINWDLIFNIYEEYIEILKQHNINAFREKDIEGDDWAWWWTTYLNSQGTNCIIWTKDKDLQQLVNIDNNKCFTVWWNKDNGMITPEFDDNNLDFLFNNDYNENDELFKTITNKNEYTQINKNEVVLDKIIRGDAGDNIMPIIFKLSKNAESGKKFRISMKDIDESLDYNDNNKVREFINNLCNSKKYFGKINVTPDKAYDHFLYNRKLVVLEKQSYPQEILDKLSTYTDYNINNDIYAVENQLYASSNQLQGILNII